MSFQPNALNMNNGINPIALMQLLAGMNGGTCGQTFHHVFESSTLNFNIDMTLKLIPKVQTPQVQVETQVATQPVKKSSIPSTSAGHKTVGKRKTVQFDVPVQPVTAPVNVVNTLVSSGTTQLKAVSLPKPMVKPIVVDEVAKRNNKFSLNKALPYNRELLSTLIPSYDSKFQPVQLLATLCNTFSSQSYEYKDTLYHVVELSDVPSTVKPNNLVLLVNESFGKLMNPSAIQNLCRDLEPGYDILKVNVSHKNYTSPRRCVTGRGLVKLCACLYTDDAAIKQVVDDMLFVATNLRWRFNRVDTVDSKANESDATDTDTDME